MTCLRAFFGKVGHRFYFRGTAMKRKRRGPQYRIAFPAGITVINEITNKKNTNVGDPDPQDPHVFVPPGSGSLIFLMCGADWNNTCKIKFWHKILAKNVIFRLKIMCLWASYKEKYEEKNICFASLKSVKKGVGSGVGSGAGSISQRYESGIRIRTKMSCIPNTGKYSINGFMHRRRILCNLHFPLYF